MADNRVKTGILVPLTRNLVADSTISNIAIFEGDNVIGRSNLLEPDKRVSRKHITLQVSADSSTKIVVEGPNPIILRSGGQRKKVSFQERANLIDGDIIELIPGHYLYKHVKGGDKRILPETNSGLLRKEKRQSVEEALVNKRIRQADTCESFSSNLQVHTILLRISYIVTQVFTSCDEEAIRHYRVTTKTLPSTFRLMQVQCVPAWANTSSITIGDVIQGNALVAILSNYMVDIDWLKVKLANWVFHKPSLPIAYGTHHSKAMLLVYPKGVRVVVHTANLIHVDWNNKTQGLWMQDFPWKGNDQCMDSLFENDLVDYLKALKVRLIASVPGYHTASNLKKWGHMKLRSVLENCVFDKEFCKSPLVYQFSSLGSLDEKWLSELAVSMSSGVSSDKSPLGIGKPLIIWPTVEDVRCSIEGYAAGNAIPSPQKNVEKAFLRKYWARWKANHVGRCHAMPHIKTYARYNAQNLAWFLLTSANLSKAAWGALQKNNSQLMIRSYELGVLFLPSSKANEKAFSCTDDHVLQQENSSSGYMTGGGSVRLATLCWKGNNPNESSKVIQLPVPYQLPPQPYDSSDEPWSWDKRYTKKDAYGQVWPRRVHLHVDQDG
ncbi:hypothetical protein ZIOFF_006532 [Zingiber officinale]|uniref:Tyrosyl-DNA phosphodiesterase 1 n=1 Tax=Zingiber officinale TaxID=94328 RepID=A0A8J5HVP5_ZINOF|nr:hypothetical protein ZIOFF_006532 [Zingiber officinale]